jgi:hypothetical protein
MSEGNDYEFHDMLMSDTTEELEDWKSRALKAEEDCQQSTRVLECKYEQIAALEERADKAEEALREIVAYNESIGCPQATEAKIARAHLEAQRP